MTIKRLLGLLFTLLLFTTGANAQLSANDTIRLGATTENGITYPMVFLPEVETIGVSIDGAGRIRRDKLRNDIFVVYPYALAAAAVFKDINDNLENLDRRRDRRQYLKSIDRNLDVTFKDPLKNLSIDQGHVLIKLINRQTGRNCFSIIRELKGGFTAVMWQSVGIFFNNNLNRDYDPESDDREIEGFVRELEASNAYRYQLSRQDELLKKIKKPQ
jgi:Domain of unknown function (DUF4294)